MRMLAQAFNTNKFLVFTRQKIASSYLTKHYQYMYNLTQIDKRFKQLPWLNLNSIDFKTDFGTSFEYPNPTKVIDNVTIPLLNDCKVTWSEFINKSSKKDLILLIRNPINRFISAFNQDCISHLLHDKTETNYIILSNILIGKIHNSDYIKFQNTFFIKVSNLDWLYNSSGLNKDIAKAIISYAIESFQIANLSIETIHNEYYLYKYYYLISLNIVDNSKIKIIDIDVINIASYLNQYDVYNFPTSYENKSKDWGVLIKNEFSTNHSDYFTRILTDLQHELFHYNILKNLPNFINNKT